MADSTEEGRDVVAALTARAEAAALRAALGELLASMQHDEHGAADPENVRRFANAVSAAEALLQVEEASGE